MKITLDDSGEVVQEESTQFYVDCRRCKIDASTCDDFLDCELERRVSDGLSSLRAILRELAFPQEYIDTIHPTSGEGMYEAYRNTPTPNMLSAYPVNVDIEENGVGYISTTVTYAVCYQGNVMANMLISDKRLFLIEKNDETGDMEVVDSKLCDEPWEADSVAFNAICEVSIRSHNNNLVCAQAVTLPGNNGTHGPQGDA